MLSPLRLFFACLGSSCECFWRAHLWHINHSGPRAVCLMTTSPNPSATSIGTHVAPISKIRHDSLALQPSASITSTSHFISMNLWLQLLQNYHIPWLPLDKVALLHRLRWKQVAWEHKLFAVDVYLRLLAPAKCRKTAFPQKTEGVRACLMAKVWGQCELNSVRRTTQ